MDLTNDFAAALLEDLISTAGITLPAMTIDSTITVAPGARQGDVDLTLTAPEPILTALAGTAIRLSAQLAATATATATRYALAFLAPAGTARFRLPPGATITGIQVPPQARGATIELPALDKPAPAAASGPSELRRCAISLPDPPVTLTAYELSDGRLCVSVEGPHQPAPDTALLLSTSITDTSTDWALLLRWSPVMEAVHSTLTVGRARQGLIWHVRPGVTKLADIPAAVLRRSQAAADGPTADTIATFLDGRR